MQINELIFYGKVKYKGDVELHIKKGDIFVEEEDLFMDGGWYHYTSFYIVMKINTSGKTLYLNELQGHISTLIKTEASGVCNWDYWKLEVTNQLKGDTFCIRRVNPDSNDSFFANIPLDKYRKATLLERYDETKVYYKTLFHDEK